MPLSIGERFKNAWNAFRVNDEMRTQLHVSGGGNSRRPDRARLKRETEQTVMASVINRMAMDAAAIDIKHVQLDENGRFLEEIDDDLNRCFNLSANLDQTGRQFRQDIFMSMLNEGCIAVIPTETSANVWNTESYKVYSARVGKIVEWYPSNIKVDLYDERDGQHHELIWPKRAALILENPMYSIMNSPNSVLKRLTHKYAVLDRIDNEIGSEKLNLIFQLPYTIKSPAKKVQAEQRRLDIENQLTKSQYGIAYIDALEHVTQLNRPIENNLMAQIEYLTSMLYGQLGFTQEILNGKASEDEMTNYQARIIEHLVSTLTDEIKRKWLTQTARSQGQSIMFFYDAFKIVPVTKVAETADSLTRNEILSSNEFRQIIGRKPSSDPSADELRNKNLNKSNEEIKGSGGGTPTPESLINRAIQKMK